METKGIHGGRREGAGRRQGEATVRKRIPLSCVPAVEQTINNVIAFRNTKNADVEIYSPAKNPSYVPRPLFLSTVQAGFPSPADDYIEHELDLNEYLVMSRPSTFFFKVKGESMSGAGINCGDMLIVDKARDARHSDIVLAVLDNEFTVKRLYMRGGVIELHPENPAFQVYKLKRESELIIWGVVCGVVRKC